MSPSTFEAGSPRASQIIGRAANGYKQLPASVKHLVFTVNSFTGQNFEAVENAYCRIVDELSGKELARFNLSDKGRHTGVVMAYLSRTAAGWDLTAVGTVANGRTAQDLSSEAAKAVRP